MRPYTSFYLILLTIGSLLLGSGCSSEKKNLSVSVSGSGSVSSDPAGIECGQQCRHDFSSGSQVTLTAAPEAGYELESWGGDCSGSESTCQLELSEDRVVTATFVQSGSQTKSLSVTVDGSGSVGSSPAGIECGQQCLHDFASGSQVTLTAAPEAGYELESWGGDCSGSELTCQLELSEDRVVTATFAESGKGDPCEGVSCSGHGTCDDGTCNCDEGYAGDDCSSCADSYVPSGSNCVPDDSSDRAFNYVGVPYPTDALPGIAGNPSTIPLMPTLPEGAFYTAHEWYAANPDAYDPVTIPTPVPPATVTEGTYVVDKFHPDATDIDQGDNAVGNVVYGTTSRPRMTMPLVESNVAFGAGTKIFVYGDGTPRPTAWDVNRKVDYEDWPTDWEFNCTAAQPCWLIGIDEPRIAANGVTLADSEHLVMDSIVLDGTNANGASLDVNGCRYITFRNSAQYGIDTNGLFDVFDSSFVMYHNNECAYTGYLGGNTFSEKDRHCVRPLYGSRYVWFVGSHIHSVSGDGMQSGNSSNPNPQERSPHYVYFAGNHVHFGRENAVDNKNSYHVVISECDIHDYYTAYGSDGGTAVILSNNDEGPWTGFHWIINSRVHDATTGIRDSSDQDGEINYAIGNLVYDIDNSALAEQDSNRTNRETVYWVNNTIHSCGRGYLRARQQSSYTSNMEGNIFSDLGLSVFASAGGSGEHDNDEDPSMHVSYNLMHGNAADTPTTGWASWSNNIVGDSEAQDPLFADTKNFVLQAQSPAIDAMPTESMAFQHFEDLYGLDIRRDHLGTKRPAGNWNMGATE